MKIRVRKGHYDENANPIPGDGGPRKNALPYNYQGDLYPPGDVIEMPDAVAKRELAILPDVLEPLDAYLARKAMYLQQKKQEHQFDREAHKRKIRDLEANVKAAQKLRGMMQEQNQALATPADTQPDASEIEEQVRRGASSDLAAIQEELAAARAARAEATQDLEVARALRSSLADEVEQVRQIRAQLEARAASAGAPAAPAARAPAKTAAAPAQKAPPADPAAPVAQG